MSYLELTGLTLAVFTFLFAVGYCAVTLINSME
jgi:hypothetical protein